METNGTRALFADPHHPYTAALLAALPERANGRRLPAIPGVVPGPFDRPRGCVFSPRCAFVFDACRDAEPPPAEPALGRARCLTPLVAGIPARACAARGRLSDRHPRGQEPDTGLLRLARRLPLARDDQGAFGRVLLASGRAHAGGGRRIRLRQIDVGAAPHLDRRSDRGRAPDRRRGRRAGERGDARAPQAGNPDRVPEPLRVAQPAPDDRQGARGAAARQHAPQAPPSARPRLCRSWPRWA